MAKPEENLIAERKSKSAQVRADGGNPFDNKVNATSNIAEFRDYYALICYDGKYVNEQVEALSQEQNSCLAGRIIFLRRNGNLTFLKVRDVSGEVQFYCDNSFMDDPSSLEVLDVGDFIEATGPAMATIAGELSIRVKTLRLLTKAYRALPFKTKLKDVEDKYRHRYVDLNVNQESLEIFKARSAIISGTRIFLTTLGFLEVETPTMSTLVGGATAKPFVTHHNALNTDLYLRVAPELFLKRLIVGGLDKVFEIGRLYRNEGLSTRHNPEFTAIEYYQAYSNYQNLMDQTEAMLRFIDDCVADSCPKFINAWREARPFTLESFARVTLENAVLNVLNKMGLPLDLPNKMTESNPSIKDWAKICKENGRIIDWSGYRQAALKTNSHGEAWYAAFEWLAEPFLTLDYKSENNKSLPVFIMDYPVEVSPLARRSDQNPNIVNRFELFIDGKEIANAFDELNDPEDQEQRFQEQMRKKSAGDEEAMDYDRDYIEALEYGMPPTAGFGMGLDRVVCILTNAPSIRDVILFPTMKARE